MQDHGRRLGTALLAALALLAAAPLAAPARARAGGEADGAAADREAKRASARKALEAGAFAEEHERDFRRAQDLYRQAAIDAAAAGDGALGAEVEARLAALEKRLAAAATKVEPDSPLGRRIRSLVGTLAEVDEKVRGRAATDLVTIGAPAVPALEDALVRPQTDALGRAADFRLAAWALGSIDAPAAVLALTRALDSPDPLVRRVVAEAAAKLPGSRPRLNPVLEKAFRDANADVRRGATKGLETGPVEIRGWLRPHLERLASEDPDSEVRENVLSRLVQIDDPDLRPVLERAARRGHGHAVTWITRHGGDERASVLEAVARDRALPLDTRRGAAYGLREVGGAGAAAALARVVVDGDPDLAREAVEQLDSLLTRAPADVPRSIPEALRTALASALVAVVERGDELRHVPSALRVLKFLPDPRAVPAVLAYLRAGGERGTEATDALRASVDDASVPMLLEEVRLAEERGRQSIADKLAYVAADEAGADHLPLLMDAARAARGDGVFRYLLRYGIVPIAVDAPDDAIRAYRAFEGARREQVVGWLFDEYEGGPPVALLLALAGDEAASLRLEGLRRLQKSAPAAALPVALERLLDRDDGVRKEALFLLERLHPGEDVVLALVARLREAEERRADGGIDPGQVVDAFRCAPPAPAARAIVGLLEEAPPLRAELRVRLFNLVASLAAPDVVAPAIVKHLPGMPTPSREWGARRLGELLYRDGVPTLIELLRDPDPKVRVEAKKALDEIKLYYREKEEWERWQKQGDEVDDVVKALDASDRRVVIGAVHAAGALKLKTALPRLVRLLATESFPWSKPGEDDPALREAVQKAIEKISAE